MPRLQAIQCPSPPRVRVRARPLVHNRPPACTRAQAPPPKEKKRLTPCSAAGRRLRGLARRRGAARAAHARVATPPLPATVPQAAAAGVRMLLLCSEQPRYAAAMRTYGGCAAERRRGVCGSRRCGSRGGGRAVAGAGRPARCVPSWRAWQRQRQLRRGTLQVLLQHGRIARVQLRRLHRAPKESLKAAREGGGVRAMEAGVVAEASEDVQLRRLHRAPKESLKAAHKGGGVRVIETRGGGQRLVSLLGCARWGGGRGEDKG
eukprot:366380-Chlamydomonas_euryale.AAC.11